MRRLFFIIAVLAPAFSNAAEMRSIDVDFSDGRYTMASVVWFDATIEQVYTVFRQWDLSEQFSSTIVEAFDVESDEQGRPGFYIRHKGCVLFFCLSFERRGHVEREPLDTLRAFADPEHSDFELSNETWTFVPEDGGTVVTYVLHMKPKFWVPPGIGPWVIKRKLRNDGGDALDRIEVIAQGIDADTSVVVD